MLTTIIDRIEEIEDEQRTRLPKTYIRNGPDPFNMYRDHEFKLRFRFSKETVREVLYPLVQHLEKLDKRGLPVSPMTKLLLSLRLYATGNLQLVSGVSSSATCEAIHTVTEIIAGKLREHINLPSTRAETEATMQWFKRTGGFPGVVAAVDGTQEVNGARCTATGMVSSPLMLRTLWISSFELSQLFEIGIEKVF